MSAAASIDRAAAGGLPDWAVVSPRRRAHIERVAGLMDEWADRAGEPPAERARWRAAAWLHDALRDADPVELRMRVPTPFRELPGKLLHGPAAAATLRIEGVTDEALLNAVTFHTVGHAVLDRMGRALYLADFLEPGREFAQEWRASLRERMPDDLPAVLREVLRARIGHVLDDGSTLRPETVEFWNAIVKP